MTETLMTTPAEELTIVQPELGQIEPAKTIEVTIDQLLEIRLLLAQAYNYEGAATVASSQNAIDLLTKAAAETDPKLAMLMQSIGSLSAVVAQQETIISNLNSQVKFCKETMGVLLLMLEQISPLTVEELEPEDSEESAE